MFASRWTRPTCRYIDDPTVSRLWTVISAWIRAGTMPHSWRNGTKRGPMDASKAKASTLRPIRQIVTYGQRRVWTS